MKYCGSMACNDGEVMDINPQRVLVGGEGDLAALAGRVDPGSIAHTAGGGAQWQLSPAGEWVAKETEV